MKKNEFRNDMLYYAATSVGKTMLDKGLITKEEYGKLDKVLLSKYNPYLGSLLPKPLDTSSI